MKIALVITRMDRGGAPDIIRSLFNYLKANGHDVTLITGPTLFPSKDTKAFIERHKGDIKIIPRLKRTPNLFSDAIAFMRLYTVFKKEGFDIVHTHTAKAGFLGRIAAKTAGARIVIHTPHGHNLYGYFNIWLTRLVIVLEKIASSFTDRIIVLTNIEKEDMIRYNICKPSKIDIVQSGINLDIYENVKIDARIKRAEFKIGEGDFLVGMISRLEAVKGPGYFIEAARYISEKLPQAKFLIVGDGPLREEMAARARELNVEDKIILAGWREDIPEILSILDVLVLTSLNEAVGRVLLEAGASAKPAVATKVGGIPEVLKDNETGILVPAGDAESVAKAVINLLTNDKKRFEMGRAARNWVNARFSEKRMVKEIHNLYNSLINI